MPRVTDAYRRARRDEIATAALRALRRNGVSRTSIADVVAESGLSAGAIYSHFRNKAELAAYVAGSLLTWRIEQFEAGSADPALRNPTGALRFMLGVFDEEEVTPDVLIQFWGAAAVDEELRTVMLGVIRRLRAAFTTAVLPWAVERAGEAGAEALAARTGSVMIALAQGFIVNRALLGPRQVDDYLRDAAVALGD
jgi:AcrR family transcriptional regulator